MLTAIFALLIIPFIILFTIGIPLIVGVVVYRDGTVIDTIYKTK